MDYNVFISHSTTNVEQVKPLCAYLEDKGLKCFVSYRDIPSGVSYPGAITRALRESEMLLLVLSKESNESMQVDRELTLANDQKKKMSCFRLEDVAYSDDKAYLMSGVNWLDAFPTPEQHYFELLQDICRQLGRDIPSMEETEEAKIERYERQLGQMMLSASKGDPDSYHELGLAYYNGNFGLNFEPEEAFRWIMKAAKKGHIEAENTIGVFYAEGIYVKKNFEEAIKWYRQAALSGNIMAQANLGNKYYFGEGVEQDISQAIKWWSLAADQGNDTAQTNLGDCYFEGEGVDIDYEKAVSLFEKAAIQDNDWAQIKLATCYRKGKGVEKNIDKCVELLETAAKNNSTGAMIELAIIYDSGEDVSQNFEKAFHFLKMAAEKNHEMGLYHLALYYKEGKGCEENQELWFEYLNKAANAGKPEAQDDLGDVYNGGYDNLNIQPDAQKALYWYQKAIEQDYSVAMVDLGLCYSAGGCLPQDDIKAAELFRRAAEKGDERGQYLLSNEYQEGDGVEQNDIEAFNWCLKSAEQSFVPSMTRLGEYYFYGIGTDQNFEKAVEWLNKASYDGDKDAQYLLGLCYELGYGIDKSYMDAIMLYKASSEQNHEKAQEAKDRLQSYMEKMADEGNPEYQYELGLYYIHALDDKIKALEYFSKAAELEYTKSYNEIAWSLHLLDRFEEALPWAEKAFAIYSEAPFVVDTLATVYQDLGRYDEAMNLFEQCLMLKQKQHDQEESMNETKEKIVILKGIIDGFNL